jgi:hypothetical protein
LIIVHLILTLGIVCFVKTIFSDPGYLSTEYSDIYSIVNFLKVFFEYILNCKEVNYKMKLNNRSSKLADDVKMILESKKAIKKIISEYKESYL